jgi:coenzyme F420-0:L-glutamate ligase/coenzyme F420-1:gamma-L-glutamate ligase
MSTPGSPEVAPALEIRALSDVPIIRRGANLGAIVGDGLDHTGIEPAAGDIVVIASKLVSRAEGRFVDLSAVVPTPRALSLARLCGKDARFVELVLREAVMVSRVAKDVLIVKNRLGMVSANAGIDASNAMPDDLDERTGPWVLLLPEDPDGCATEIRCALERRYGASLGVVISDSLGRPFRLGTVGVAIGASGIPVLFDHRGKTDLFGRALEHTVTALADQIATAADLVAGQSDEARGVVHVRGLRYDAVESSARALVRPAKEDLYLAPRAGIDP